MNTLPEIIFLSGFSGSGKSEVGQILAGKLNFYFTDTDEVVEGKTNKSIPEIFAQMGEDRFRFMENDVVRMAVQRTPHVISLGGGTIQSEEVLKYIKGFGMLVFLETSVDSIYDRLKENIHLRPLLDMVAQGSDSPEKAIRERIVKLYKERSKFYEQSDIKIITDSKTSEQVACEIEGLFRQDAKE